MNYINKEITNPWKEISLSDYENHMKLDSVKQLQAMNQTMKYQLNDYDVTSVMILGIAGGNGLEHVGRQYLKVYGIDINESYLKAVEERYSKISNVLECTNIDIINEADSLPQAELLIANLLIEYIGYDAFSKAVCNVKPKYVSCVIQINDTSKQWVSDSPYLHAFDGLDSVHHQMEEVKLTEKMREIGYKFTKTASDILPNGKRLVRLDYEKCLFEI